MSIAFFGSSNFAIPSLEALHKNFDIKVIYTQPPQKSGRGMKLTNTPTHNFGLQNGIDVRTPNKLTQDDANFLTSLNIQFIIVVSYGLILPNFILDTANYGGFNIHPSSLPKFRGGAPIERTIESGDTQTNICIIKMVKQLDAGDIVYQSSPINIEGQGAVALSEQFASQGAAAIVNLLNNIRQNNGTAQMTHAAQNNEMASYAHKITKQDLILTPQQTLLLSSNQVRCKILAFEKYGLCLNLLERDMKVFSFISPQQLAQITKPIHFDKILQNAIKCCDGIVIPHRITPLNGKQMLFKDMALAFR